jgi:hypothetical protein
MSALRESVSVDEESEPLVHRTKAREQECGDKQVSSNPGKFTQESAPALWGTQVSHAAALILMSPDFVPKPTVSDTILPQLVFIE